MGGAKKKKRSAREGELEADEALALLEGLRQPEGLPTTTLLRLLSGHQPCCDANNTTCKGRKDNPNCLCGLVPAPGSFRKKGLWQKEPTAITNLGGDPNEQKRTDFAKPCGLRNLGNTCYVNSALQCMFNMPDFRRALFDVQPPIADDEIVAQLRQLLLRREFGPHASVDTAAFAKVLNLSHSIQQDGQEFFKLLITKLEGLFATSPDPAIRQLVPSLFRGTYSYVTQCKACGQQSASSANLQDFHELPLQVRGFGTLLESLVSSLAAEQLTGDNQYYCERCGLKADASRQMVLRSAPPYLCLALQRFLFDYSTMDKMKASDKFSFPVELNLDSVACMASEDGRTEPVRGYDGRPASAYQLQAVLIHKGNSASHGHYVAHIRDAASGRWWRFDDEVVTRMSGPAGHPADHGTTAAAVAAAAEKEKGGKDAGSGGGGEAGGSSTKKGARSGGGSSSSKKATLTAAGTESGGKAGGARGRSKKAAASGTPNGQQQQGAGAADAEGAAAGGTPSAAADAATAAAGGDAAPSAAPAAAVSDITSSNAYMLVYRQVGWCPPDVPDRPSSLPPHLRTVVSQMQEEFDAACGEHVVMRGQVMDEVKKRQEEVRSILAAAAVEPQMEGPPEEDEDEEEEAAAAATARQRRRTGAMASTSQRAASAAAKAARYAPGPSRWISSAWLEQWSGGDEAPSPVDNAVLLCPHGKLDPAKCKSGAARRISVVAWETLREAHGGGPELATRDACPTCLQASLDAVVNAGQADHVREDVVRLLTEAAAVEREGGAEDVEEVAARVGGDAFYVSKTWLSGWAKRQGSSMSATSPTSAICCPHGQLVPEAAGAKAKRVAVPRDTWRWLVHLWEVEQRRARERPPKKGVAAAAAAAAAGGGGGKAAPEVINLEADVDMVEDLSGASPGKQPPAAPSLPDEAPVATGRGRRRKEPALPAAPAAAGGIDAADALQQQAAGSAAAAAGSSADRPQDDEVVLTAEVPACVSFPLLDSSECAECLAALRFSEAASVVVRKDVEAEKAALGTVANNAVSTPLEAGATYYLLPASWLRTWQEYVSSGGKKAQTAAATAAAAAAKRPPPVAEAIEPLLCSCCPGDPRLIVPPPALTSKRQRFVQDDADKDVYRLVTESEWNAICSFYGPGAGGEAQQQQQQQAAGAAEGKDPVRLAAAARGIQAYLQLSPGGGAATKREASQEPSGRGTPPPPPSDGQPMDGVEGAGGAVADGSVEPSTSAPVQQGSAQPAHGASLLTVPGVCQVSVEAAQQAARRAQLTYVGAEVMVEVIKAEDVAAAFADRGGARQSRRARKGRAPLRVDCTNTLRELRYKIFEALHVHPMNQDVYVRGSKVEAADEATLADLEILPDEEMRIVNTELVDNDDYSSLFDYKPNGKKREKEVGFANTALLGSQTAAAAAGSGAGTDANGASGSGAAPSNMDVDV